MSCRVPTIEPRTVRPLSTISACGPEPGVAHEVTDRKIRDALPERHNLADAFVARHKRR